MDSIPDTPRNRADTPRNRADTHHKVTPRNRVDTHPNKDTHHRVTHPNKGIHPSKGTHPKDIHKLDILVTLVPPIKATDHTGAWAWVEC